MFENFEVDDPLFAGQVHERPQFKLLINGEEYQGIITKGEVNWYHPKPEGIIEEAHLQAVENKIHGIMQKHLQ